MKVNYINIHSRNIDDVVNFLNIQFNFKIESRGEGNIVLIKEEYYLRNSGMQLNMIILNLINSLIQVDIVSSGGELTNLLWKNSELYFVESVESEIIKFCDTLNIKVEKTN